MPPLHSVRTIRSQVYEIIKAQICSGVYPPGFWLQEQELANSLQVSRSPVREALRQLVSNGLADEIPNKGVFVRRFTSQDIDEIFELRILLENYAIRRNSGLPTPGQLSQLSTLLQELEGAHFAGDVSLYTELDDRLHLLIVEQGGNQLVAEVYDRVHNMVQQFRIYSLLAQTRFQDSLEEHRQLVTALLAGDYQSAVQINCTHLDSARQQILSQLARSPLSDA